EGAVRVPGGGGAAQVGGDGLGGGADVQRQADRSQWPLVQSRAEPGGQPPGAGQGVRGQAQQRPAQPVPRGRAERRAPGAGRVARGGAAGRGARLGAGGGGCRAAAGPGAGASGARTGRRAGGDGQEDVREVVQGGPVHVAGNDGDDGGVADGRLG